MHSPKVTAPFEASQAIVFAVTTMALVGTVGLSALGLTMTWSVPAFVLVSLVLLALARPFLRRVHPEPAGRE